MGKPPDLSDALYAGGGSSAGGKSNVSLSPIDNVGDDGGRVVVVVKEMKGCAEPVWWALLASYGSVMAIMWRRLACAKSAAAPSFMRSRHTRARIQYGHRRFGIKAITSTDK